MSGQAKFRDDDGWLWEAIERPREYEDTARIDTATPRVIYFLSRYETRRRDDVPPDWHLRSGDELLDLFRSARPI